MDKVDIVDIMDIATLWIGNRVHAVHNVHSVHSVHNVHQMIIAPSLDVFVSGRSYPLTTLFSPHSSPIENCVIC
jgi:hypothetical protein